MPNHLIFEGDVKERSKDILFFITYPCMVIQVVHLPVDSFLMSSCAHLFTVCH
jgi:hypothetical protein